MGTFVTLGKNEKPEPKKWDGEDDKCDFAHVLDIDTNSTRARLKTPG